MEHYSFTFKTGHIELRTDQRLENGRIVFYNYSVTYDDAGDEVARTEPTASGSLGWHDNSPVSEKDFLSFVRR